MVWLVVNVRERDALLYRQISQKKNVFWGNFFSHKNCGCNFEKYQVWTIYDPSMPYLITATKSTCGCKDDKDECDTEKNPVWDRAALQCFQQIIWFTLEKFNLSFVHFESFGSGSTSFLWKFSLTAFPSRSGSSMGSWSIPCIKLQGSPLPFFKANWQIVEDCINFTFFARLGSSCQKDWLSLLF